MLLILLEDWSCEPPFVNQFINKVFGTNFKQGAAGSDLSNRAAPIERARRKQRGPEAPMKKPA